MQALLHVHHLDDYAVLEVILQRAGFTVRRVDDLNKAVTKWDQTPIQLDLVLLSRGAIPPVSEKMAKEIEALRGVTLAPLVLIAENMSDDNQSAFYEAGADLVVTRPYSTRILIAQLRALLRRSYGMPFTDLPLLTHSGVMVDPSTRTVRVHDKEPVRLTQLEFRLLFTLMTHAGRVIPSRNLVEYVWGYRDEEGRTLLRGLVQRLRTKVEPDPQAPDFILTEKGIGYRFMPGEEPQAI